MISYKLFELSHVRLIYLNLSSVLNFEEYIKIIKIDYDIFMVIFSIYFYNFFKINYKNSLEHLLNNLSLLYIYL